MTELLLAGYLVGTIGLAGLDLVIGPSGRNPLEVFFTCALWPLLIPIAVIALIAAGWRALTRKGF